MKRTMVRFDRVILPLKLIKITAFDLRKYWAKKFRSHNIPESEHSADCLIAYAMNNIPVVDMKKKCRLSFLNTNQVEEINRFCNQRLRRMPVQYIIGEWQFRDLTLKMRPPVLIPRPETESLIDIIQADYGGDQAMKFAEIGCGSGAISISLLKLFPKAECVAIDANEIACCLSRENALDHAVHPRMSVCHDILLDDGTLQNNSILDDCKFDFIVSNPPYIKTDEMAELAPEISTFEDSLALDGGIDGLRVIKSLIRFANKSLRGRGHQLFVEIHHEHRTPIREILNDEIFSSSMKLIACYKDFAGYDRFVQIIKK